MELTEYDKELIEELKFDISNSLIKIIETLEPYINEMEEQFDFMYSGINWNEQNIIFSEKIEKQSMDKEKNILSFLNKIILNYPNLENEMIIVIGDYITNIGYSMNYNFFIDKHKYFFDLPQDTYLWFTKSKKIINYTFEDELFFG